MRIHDTNHPFGVGFANFVLPLLRTKSANVIKSQLAAGLGTTVASLNNNTYEMPYNINNIHQLDINSNSFGFSVQKQDIIYPGFAVGATATRGWAMYLPSAFTLTVSEPTSIFVSNITNGQAALGNIIPLPAAYKNCYGGLTFC